MSIANRDANEVLSLKRSDDTGDRTHVVFGGTKILQVCFANLLLTCC